MKTLGPGAAALVLVLCFTTVSCGRKNERSVTEIVDGVRVVRNLNVKPGTAPRNLAFFEELTIGGDEAGEDILLYSPVDIDADRSGDIYILDSRDAVIRRFDRDGSFVREIGRKGQGPGEFDGPAAMEITAEGRMIVADPSQMRLTTMSADGDFIASVLLKDYVSNLSYGEGGLVIAGYDSAGSEYRVGSLDLGSGRITTLFSQATYWPARVMNEKMRYDFPYLVRWALNSKKELVVGSAVAYELNVMDVQGRLKFKFKKDFERIPLRGEMLNRVSEIGLKGPNPYVRDPYYPVFESLAIDPQDRVWVQLYQPKWANRTNPDTPYDVFASDGRFLFETRIPGHISSRLVFKNGRIYVLKKADSGYVKAARLRLDE